MFQLRAAGGGATRCARGEDVLEHDAFTAGYLKLAEQGDFLLDREGGRLVAVNL